jgi:hypothetical protein
MNEFRMGLRKDRAAAIRPDLDRAREITQKAENERRDLTPEEQAIVEPTSPGALVADLAADRWVPPPVTTT